ncbi:MAG: hypothetical protein JW712_07180 [Dehalococcoidales bacterium]|nr:hypothetical protein [Dehalococcoidales bacterium]
MLNKVHVRVLWDLGWISETIKDGGGFFNYYRLGDAQYPNGRNLIYGTNRETFLSPLKGYGIPDPQPGAIRQVRLYANYGHQMESEGTPTIRIGDVEFSLPRISGFYGDMGANWSNFVSYDKYSHLVHAPIAVYNKDGASGSFWQHKPQGTMYRIEAYFYDEYPDKKEK